MARTAERTLTTLVTPNTLERLDVTESMVREWISWYHESEKGIDEFLDGMRQLGISGNALSDCEKMW